MLYDKLPIVFLSTMASEKKDATNSQIASYILDHLEDVSHMGIQEMADSCHVAISSISRFCKEIGLRDFAELRELLSSTNMRFEEQSSSSTPQERLHDYSEKVVESIQMVENSVSMDRIDSLCDAIHQHEHVALYGLLKASGVALNLQGDLLMLGKQSFTSISYAHQIEEILSAKEEDLIIIFTYTGGYFDYQDLRALKRRKTIPAIWLICSEGSSYPEFIHDVVTFHSLRDQNSHPYQLQFIASLIAQEYARKYRS